MCELTQLVGPKLLAQYLALNKGLPEAVPLNTKELMSMGEFLTSTQDGEVILVGVLKYSRTLWGLPLTDPSPIASVVVPL